MFIFVEYQPFITLKHYQNHAEKKSWILNTLGKGMLWAEVDISVLIICKFSNEWTCTRKKDVEGLSCGFEEK